MSAAIRYPTLQGNHEWVAETALDQLVSDYIETCREVGKSPEQIQALVDDHFGDLVVRASTPLNRRAPYLYLLWPADADTISTALLRSLGPDDLTRMDNWAFEELKEQGAKVAIGGDHVFRFDHADWARA